jgi:hypothetical protein
MTKILQNFVSRILPAGGIKACDAMQWEEVSCGAVALGPDLSPCV